MAWRYACNIPSHITGKDENGEPVVLYRVNIFFQQQSPDVSASSDSNAAPVTDSAPFFVLRRYSQFRHLHDQLKAAFPAAMSARGMAPPPKHPLVLGDKRDALERRRADLERWLWRLVATAEVARGPQLKAFLELDKALSRAQLQQQRLRLEQQQRLLDNGRADRPEGLRGSSGTAPPSESGYGRHHHLGAYPGGAGGASVLGDDSASDASGPSGAGSTVGAQSSLAPKAAAAATAVVAEGPGGAGGTVDGGPNARYSVLPDPRVGAPGRGEGEQWPSSLGAGVSTVASAAAIEASRLGLHLRNRADIRRLVDLLVERLEAACSETAAAVSEAMMLRDANQAMAARLGELELERSGAAEAEEVRSRLVESEAVRASLEQRLVQLDETLAASRNVAHAQQLAQLQSQLLEARTDNDELLRRLQEWDVGSSSSNTAAVLAAQQQAAELQQQLDEQLQHRDELQHRLDEQQRCFEVQRGEVDEQRQRADEQEQRANELQGRLEEQQVHCRADEPELRNRLDQLGQELQAAEARAATLKGQLQEQAQQLEDERTRREQAEAEAARQMAAASSSQQQQQALLDRARADNALLAREVQRLRTAAAAERETHRSALEAHSQASAQLAARVREVEAKLVSAAAASAAVPSQPAAQTQELLLL